MTNEVVNTPNDPSPAVDARQILRRAGKAALATLDRTTGYPYASLVSTATEPNGAPILLLSRLALHTQNIEADPRASLLIEDGAASADPLAAGRITLFGRIARAVSETAERRYLAVHPSAAAYAGFGDFDFFVFEIERAHYVGGFGRIRSIGADELLTDVSGADTLVAAEPAILTALNRDDAEKIARLGAWLSGGQQGAWRVTGIDPAGIDLMQGGDRCRFVFPAPVKDMDEIRHAVAMAFDAAERT